MFDYEFGKAGSTLDELKANLKKYLINSYNDKDDPENPAEATYKYIENAVDRIIKRQEYKFQFGDGGSPMWHAAIFKYLSHWVTLEIKMCELLAKELDAELDSELSD